MEGTDHLDLHPGGPLQQGLDLGTVLAHDVGVVAAGIVQPVPLKVHLIGKDVAVQGAEKVPKASAENSTLSAAS